MIKYGNKPMGVNIRSLTWKSITHQDLKCDNKFVCKGNLSSPTRCSEHFWARRLRISVIMQEGKQAHWNKVHFKHLYWNYSFGIVPSGM